MFSRFLARALVALALIPAIPANAEDSVGSVSLVRDSAEERFGDESWDELFLDQAVFSDQFVRTPEDAAMHVLFVDGSVFRMGANSDAQIDRYLFDPERGQGEVALTLTSGVFRFISGSMNQLQDSEITVETPTTTLGIRGTDVTVEVQDDADILFVREGIVAVAPHGCPATGAETLVTAGQTARVDGPSCAVARGTAPPRADSGLD